MNLLSVTFKGDQSDFLLPVELGNNSSLVPNGARGDTRHASLPHGES